MRVLGIDPGSRKTGWAVLEQQGRKIVHVSSGTLIFNGQKDFLPRLFEIKSEFTELIGGLEFDHVALESLIYVKSPTALIKLAQTRGVFLSCLSAFENTIFEYSPNLIKSSTVGHGHAGKDSVQKFLSMSLGINSFKTDDESDAIAVAMCHILNFANVSTKLIKTKGRGSLSKALSHKVKDIQKGM